MPGAEGLFQPPGAPLLRDPGDERIGDLPVDERLALLGIPWDWGVTGRPGSREAPRAIRSRLYSLRPYSPRLGRLAGRPMDYGDLRVAPGDWGVTAERASRAARYLAERHSFTLILGGDHSITEWTAPAFHGEGTLGILLLDAHYDMRSVSEGYTSGMWLWRLRERLGDRLRVAIVGVADYANPAYLAERAEEAGFLVIPAEDVHRDPSIAYDAVDWLEENATQYYVSIDIDHLDASIAPGVNSPSSHGLQLHHTLALLEEAIPRLCPRAADIVEVVPHADPTGATVLHATLIAARTLHLATGCGGTR